jgi:hypothetical protein
MRSFIFVTHEGYTYQPDSESIEPDVENLQVLGFATGVDDDDAFKNLIREDEWLVQSAFDNVKCLELKHEDYEHHARFFSIKNALSDASVENDQEES